MGSVDAPSPSARCFITVSNPATEREAHGFEHADMAEAQPIRKSSAIPDHIRVTDDTPVAPSMTRYGSPSPTI